MPTKPSELYRLFDGQGQAPTEAYKGRTLAAQAGDVFGTWIRTFFDDFNDLSSISNNDGAGPWFAPGPYTTAGIGTHQPKTGGSAVTIFQSSTSKLGLMCKRVGASYYSANIASANGSAIDIDHEPSIGFAQQYGYFECDTKVSDPTAPTIFGVLWPAFWLYSCNSLGGSTGNVGTPTIELDGPEQYHGGGDLSIHYTNHKHEELKRVDPGYWSRDINKSNTETLSGDNLNNPIGYAGNFASFGTDANFRTWNASHKYGILITQEWVIYYFDRVEVCRYPMIQENHQAFYMLVSQQFLSANVSGTTPDGQAYTQEVESVAVWQNPDWLGTTGAFMAREPVTAGGSANARTVTSALGFASGYAGETGRTILAKIPAANTDAMTLDGGQGAKPVYAYSQQDLVPPGGTLGALVGGETIAGGWHAFKFDSTLNAGGGGWLLLNAGWNLRHPRTSDFVPPVLAPTPVAIDIPAVEGALAIKHGLAGTLFPIGHPARSPSIDTTIIVPRMPIQKLITIVEQHTAGYSLGSVQVENVPTDAVRYRMAANAYFKINPDTGEITVKTGATTAIGTYTLDVYAWPTTPRPIPPGENHCIVTVTVLALQPFDLSYFGATLDYWLDAQTSGDITLVSTKVSAIAPHQGYGLPATQATDANRPSYSATGINGLPAIVSATGANHIDFTAAVADSTTLQNLATRGSNNVVSIKLNATSRLSAAAFDYLSAHMGMFIWAPGVVQCWRNDISVAMDAATIYTGITTSGMICWVYDGASAGGGGLGRIIDQESGFRLFNSSAFTAGLDGALGELGIEIGTAMTTAIRNKVFGYLAHRWNLTGSLASDHPYKTVVPNMFD